MGVDCRVLVNTSRRGLYAVLLDVVYKNSLKLEYFSPKIIRLTISTPTIFNQEKTSPITSNLPVLLVRTQVYFAMRFVSGIFA